MPKNCESGYEASPPWHCHSRRVVPRLSSAASALLRPFRSSTTQLFIAIGGVLFLAFRTRGPSPDERNNKTLPSLFWTPIFVVAFPCRGFGVWCGEADGRHWLFIFDSHPMCVTAFTRFLFCDFERLPPPILTFDPRWGSLSYVSLACVDLTFSQLALATQDPQSLQPFFRRTICLPRGEFRCSFPSSYISGFFKLSEASRQSAYHSSLPKEPDFEELLLHKLSYSNRESFHRSYKNILPRTPRGPFPPLFADVHSEMKL